MVPPRSTDVQKRTRRARRCHRREGGGGGDGSGRRGLARHWAARRGGVAGGRAGGAVIGGRREGRGEGPRRAAWAGPGQKEKLAAATAAVGSAELRGCGAQVSDGTGRNGTERDEAGPVGRTRGEPPPARAGRPRGVTRRRARAASRLAPRSALSDVSVPQVGPAAPSPSRSR